MLFLIVDMMLTLNKIYTGGEMLLRYGWPQIDQHALQFEIRRDLYMDEESRQKQVNLLKCKMIVLRF